MGMRRRMRRWGEKKGGALASHMVSEPSLPAAHKRLFSQAMLMIFVYHIHSCEKEVGKVSRRPQSDFIPWGLGVSCEQHTYPSIPRKRKERRMGRRRGRRRRKVTIRSALQSQTTGHRNRGDRGWNYPPLEHFGEESRPSPRILQARRQRKYDDNEEEEVDKDEKEKVPGPILSARSRGDLRWTSLISKLHP